MNIFSRKDESYQKIPTKKDEPSVASQRISSKKEESTPGNQKKEESGNQGDVAVATANASGTPGQPEHLHSIGSSTVLKSGPLFLSCKGIGWTSWKKRWFVLTPTSLVFFRSDPSAISQKESEVNLTLGGIDLNNSGSVVVKADKKLLTVLFPDGRDGRAFTLKAETLEELNDWKAALENALSQAPSSANVMGQNGILGNDQVDADDGSKEPEDDQRPVKSSILQTPILHALEDADGTPAFMEKALRFVEEHGGEVEGILRQAADVEHVKQRIREYEQGKTEFSSEEDPHVIADCVKYVIREMPSSPIPASCCKALLEACRTARGARVNAMRVAVMDTCPEPNRRLLQRILIMMQKVASHKAKNLMSPSAVSACMAPLLLRPLLAGECNIENDFDVGADGSQQLLQAAAAANHAQAIVITLFEEYDKIFGEGSVSPYLYSDSDEGASEDDESYEDDESCDDDGSHDEYEDDDASVRSEHDDDDNVTSGTSSDLDDDKDSGYLTSVSDSSEADDNLKASKKSSSSLPENVGSNGSEDRQSSNNSTKESFKSVEPSKDVCGETKLEDKQTNAKPFSRVPKSTSSGRPGLIPRYNHFGRTAAKKNLSMESIDFPCEEEEEIEILKAEKADLQDKLTKEVKSNAVLEARLEERKKTLHDHRLALEKDVARLEKDLQKERDKKMALEAGLNPSQGSISPKDTTQAEADVIDSNKKVDDLGMLDNEQLADDAVSVTDSCNKNQPNHQAKMKDKPKPAELRRSRSKEKDRNTDDADYRKVKKQENKRSSQRQGLFGRTVSNGVAADSSLTSSSTKKSAGVSDVANSRSSTITRLTNRLNFRKDRRSQANNETEEMENAGGVPNSDKGKGSEPAQNPEKGRDPDVTQ